MHVVTELFQTTLKQNITVGIARDCSIRWGQIDFVTQELPIKIGSVSNNYDCDPRYHIRI